MHMAMAAAPAATAAALTTASVTVKMTQMLDVLAVVVAALLLLIMIPSRLVLTGRCMWATWLPPLMRTHWERCSHRLDKYCKYR